MDSASITLFTSCSAFFVCSVVSLSVSARTVSSCLAAACPTSCAALLVGLLEGGGSAAPCAENKPACALLAALGCTVVRLGSALGAAGSGVVEIDMLYSCQNRLSLGPDQI